MTEVAWIDMALRSARPRALGALVRTFRDLDSAEEAFQEACLSALKHWPQNGPPRDPAAWLIFVGRNAGIDAARRRNKERELPAEDAFAASDTVTGAYQVEAALAESIDGADYRDDILRLLFICCHPDLPAAQQISLALRVVCGLTVREIARAFVASDAAIEQRITRAKSRVAAAQVPFETPDVDERATRLDAVAAVLYLMFNEGYSATGGDAHIRGALCEEAIRLARLLLRLYPDEAEIMGLLSLMLLQHARVAARLDSDGTIVLLEDQDRGLWSRPLIAEGLALLDKAVRHQRRGPFQVQAAIAALHARATRAEETDWTGIERLYGALEEIAPSPVVTLNRGVAVSKARGPAAALALIEPLSGPLEGYFHFHGVKGALLLQVGRSAEARVALNRAISLARTAAEAAHIRAQIDRLVAGGSPAPREA